MTVIANRTLHTMLEVYTELNPTKIPEYKEQMDELKYKSEDCKECGDNYYCDYHAFVEQKFYYALMGDSKLEEIHAVKIKDTPTENKNISVVKDFFETKFGLK